MGELEIRIRSKYELKNCKKLKKHGWKSEKVNEIQGF